MLGCFVVFVAIIGLSVGQDSCVTDDKINAVNNAIDTINNNQTIIDFRNSSQTTVNTLSYVNFLCNDNTMFDQLTVIENTIRPCKELVNETNVDALNLHTFMFTYVYTMYDSLDNFCMCFGPYMHANELNMTADMLTTDVPDGEYTMVINTDYLCMNDTKEGVEMVVQKWNDCTMVKPQLTHSRLTKKNLLRMAGFISKGHCDVAANLTCAFMESTTAEFKHCMKIVKSTTSDTGKALCERSSCIDLYVGDACGHDTAVVYKWAVGMYGHTNDVELVDSDCSSASTLLTSIVFVSTVSLLTKFL